MLSGIEFKARGVPWQKGCRLPALHVDGLNDDFCPSLMPNGKKKLTEEQAKLAAHGVFPGQPLKLPPISCAFDPPLLLLPPGGSGQSVCPLGRIELVHSFFDVFVTLESTTPGFDVAITPGPTVMLARGARSGVQVAVTDRGNAPGDYVLRLKGTEGAAGAKGGSRAVRFFDLPVRVQSPAPGGGGGGGGPPPSFQGSCSGSLSNLVGNSVQWSFACDKDVNGFDIVVSGRQIQTYNAPAGYTCTITTTSATYDTLHCTGNLAANTSLQGRIYTSPPPAPGMGAQLFAYQGSVKSGAFTLNGP
jgi:hypothetical protein